MNKLLLTAILTMGIALASAPVMAKHGADDPAGHDTAEHAGGDQHAGGDKHAGGHETTEQEAAEHDVDDIPAPAP